MDKRLLALLSKTTKILSDPKLFSVTQAFNFHLCAWELHGHCWAVHSKVLFKIPNAYFYLVSCSIFQMLLLLN